MALRKSFSRSLTSRSLSITFCLFSLSRPASVQCSLTSERAFSKPATWPSLANERAVSSFASMAACLAAQPLSGALWRRPAGRQRAAGRRRAAARPAAVKDEWTSVGSLIERLVRLPDDGSAERPGRRMRQAAAGVTKAQVCQQTARLWLSGSKVRRPGVSGEGPWFGHSGTTRPNVVRRHRERENRDAYADPLGSHAYPAAGPGAARRRLVVVAGRGPAPPALAGHSEDSSLKVAGLRRHYLLYVPPGVSEGAPLLVVLHGSRGDGRADAPHQRLRLRPAGGARRFPGGLPGRLRGPLERLPQGRQLFGAAA